MNKVNPVDIRSAIKVSNTLASSGIMFIPMPVLSKDDAKQLAADAFIRLESIELSNKK